MNRSRAIEASRLCAAADVLLAAAESQEGMNALVEIVVDGCVIAESHNAGAFTEREYSAAMEFLVRLGFLGGAVWSGESPPGCGGT